MGMSPHEWAYFGLLATLQGGLKIKDPGTTKTIPIQKNFGVCPLTIAAASETRSLVTASKVGVGTRLVVVADQITGGGDVTISGVNLNVEGQYAEFICVQYNGANAWVATTAYVGGATTTEINRVADVSARSIAGGATEEVQEGTHDSRTILLDTAANTAVTLPDPVVGMRIRILTSVKSTGTGHTITCGSGTFQGIAYMLDLDGAAVTAYESTAGTLLTLNGTTTGGQVGDWIELEGITATKWAIVAYLRVPTGSNPATPFSAS